MSAGTGSRPSVGSRPLMEALSRSGRAPTRDEPSCGSRPRPAGGSRASLSTTAIASTGWSSARRPMGSSWPRPLRGAGRRTSWSASGPSALGLGLRHSSSSAARGSASTRWLGSSAYRSIGSACTPRSAARSSACSRPIRSSAPLRSIASAQARPGPREPRGEPRALRWLAVADFDIGHVQLVDDGDVGRAQIALTDE